MKKSLEGKVVIITGGGRGIGAACAKLFCERGAQVVVASRSKEELSNLEKEIAKKFGAENIFAVPTDITQESEVQSLFERTLQKFGHINVLVNNAGAIDVVDFAKQTLEQWNHILAVNLTGTFLCSREFFKRSKGNGGTIVNVSSLSGIRGTEKFKGFSAYVAAKHAVVGLTEALAVEGREFRIRVNCIAPGAVDTLMLKQAAPFLKTNTKPDDIAPTVLFLCDDHQSGSVSGAVIEIHSNL